MLPKKSYVGALPLAKEKLMGRTGICGKIEKMEEAEINTIQSIT